MMQKLAVLFSMALLASACAEGRPQAVFELDATGGASMAISEGAEVGADEAQLRASADESNTITLTGSLTDDTSISSPDYALKATLQGGKSQMAFDISGVDVSSLISSFGQFGIKATVSTSGGKLLVDASGTLERRMLSEMFMIDPELLQDDLDGFKSDLQDAVNELFALMPVETTPQATITEFGLSGEDTLSFTLKMEIEGWSAFLAPSDAGGAGAPGFMRCLGIDTGQLLASALSSQGDTTIEFSASGGKLSGSIELPVSASGSQALQSMTLDVTKSGAKTDIRGSLKVAKAKDVFACMVQGYIPDYVAGKTDFVLAKARTGAATQSIEADIAGLATKSGEEYIIAFPAEMTSDFDIKVKIPSDLSILSVEGGKVSGGVADSEAGKEFKVTYGKGGSGMDMTIVVIIIAAIAAVAALFLIRNYNLKKRAGGQRPSSPQAHARHIAHPPAGPGNAHPRF